MPSVALESVPATSAAVDRHVVAFRSLTVAAVAGGVLIRVVQYANKGSLWLDEIAVARNVIGHSVFDLLTTPLDYQQSAPKGFLAVEKFATTVAGNGDHVLRAWPFVASIAALLLCWRLATRVLSPVGAFVSVAAMAFGASLIRHTSEVKQYGTDMAVGLLLLCLTLFPRKDRRGDLTAALVGAVAIWFSQPAVIVAGCMVLALAWTARRRRAEAPSPRVVYRVAFWSVSTAAAVSVGIRSLTPATNDYMHRYWASGFPPATWREIFESAWPWDPMLQLFATGGGGFNNGLGYPLAAVYVGVALIGLGLLLWRSPRVGVTLALPLVATIGAATLHEYPFRDRVILFLLPIFFIGIGEATATLYTRLARVRPAVGGMVVLAVVAGTVVPVLRVRPPYTYEDVHPIMAALSRDRPNQPAIFLHYNAAPAFEYYARQYGFSPHDYSIASCGVRFPADALRDVDRTLRGERRAWVVFVHVTALVAPERTDLLRYLDTIGRRLDRIAIPSHRAFIQPLPSEAVLYDLSDPALLARADAETFPITSNFNRGANCLEGPQTMSVPRLAVGGRRAEMNIGVPDVTKP
jgi:hypothetical protein